MNSGGKAAQRLVRRALSGKASHAETREIASGLDWKAAGRKPRGAAHSVYELVWHMSYWQDWGLAWLEGRRPAVPRHASESWPAAAGPADSDEWERGIDRFRRGRGLLERACRSEASMPDGRAAKRLEMIHAIAVHNSYHCGQVAFLRQMIGAWPPPSGGITW
jgi:hypothetical protein